VTLIDVADTLAVMGDREGFEAAVRLIIDQVSFDQDVKVQVFEVVSPAELHSLSPAERNTRRRCRSPQQLRRDLPVRRALKTIRVLGGLLSTHLLALSNHPTHPGFALDWYNSELLHLATDLADRLLPAFRTPTGIPLARINLRRGIAKGETVETCAAGAGSLLLEWIVLSRLTGVSLYEEVATKAFYAVWGRRSERSLIGNALNAFNGVRPSSGLLSAFSAFADASIVSPPSSAQAWIPPLISHVGAGVDSFIEYAYKVCKSLAGRLLEIPLPDLVLPVSTGLHPHWRGALPRRLPRLLRWRHDLRPRRHRLLGACPKQLRGV
jgi:mannosidase alpha-like ER degradation enhancer 1